MPGMSGMLGARVRVRELGGPSLPRPEGREDGARDERPDIRGVLVHHVLPDTVYGGIPVHASGGILA